MSHPIFRQEAIHARRTAPLGTVILATPVSFKVYCAVAALVSAAFISFLSFASYTRRVNVSGLLQVEGGVSRVKAAAPGLVASRLVGEGAEVIEGQALYVISTERTTSAYGETQAAIIRQLNEKQKRVSEERQRLAGQYAQDEARARRDIESFAREIEALGGQLKAQRDQLGLSEQTLGRSLALVKEGFIAADALKLKQSDLAEQHARVAGLERELISTQRSLAGRRDDLAALPLKRDRDLDSLERSTSDISVELNEQEAKRRVVIISPRRGIATAVTAQVGQPVTADTPLLTIVPADPQFRGALFANSKALGMIKVGDSLLISYQAFPHERFGMSEGRVTSISAAPLSAAEVAQATPGAELQLPGADGPYYLIEVDIAAAARQQVNPGLRYRAGMIIEASVAVERKRLHEWLTEPLTTLWRRSAPAETGRAQP